MFIFDLCMYVYLNIFYHSLLSLFEAYPKFRKLTKISSQFWNNVNATRRKLQAYNVTSMSTCVSKILRKYISCYGLYFAYCCHWFFKRQTTTPNAVERSALLERHSIVLSLTPGFPTSRSSASIEGSGTIYGKKSSD